MIEENLPNDATKQNVCDVVFVLITINTLYKILERWLSKCGFIQ